MHFRTLAGNHEITVPAACGWSRLATCIPAARDSRGQIAVLAASVLPSDAVAIGGAIPEWQAPLFSTELAHVRRAVPARRAEFTAGRTCARRALETLGAPAQAIGTGPRREPRWPAGVVGSISHAAGRCVAAVAPADHLAGLGIDLESADPLSEELARMVCGPQEMGWCARQPVRLQGRLRKLIFSAKESVFKCLYPVFRREIDFADARIAVNLSSGQLRAEITRAGLGDTGHVLLVGRFAVCGDLLMTAFSLPRVATPELPDPSSFRFDYPVSQGRA